MWNKITLSCLLVLGCCFCFGDVKDKKTSYQAEINALLRKDPRMPDLTPAVINNHLEMIRNIFINHKLPEQVNQLTVKNKIGYNKLKIVAELFKKLVDNPELQESSGNKKEWFLNIGRTLVGLAPALGEIDDAYKSQDSKVYQQAKREYLNKIQALDKIMKTPEKLPVKELEKLKEENTLRRKNEIAKKINELNKARRTIR